MRDMHPDAIAEVRRQAYEAGGDNLADLSDEQVARLMKTHMVNLELRLRDLGRAFRASLGLRR